MTRFSKSMIVPSLLAILVLFTVAPQNCQAQARKTEVSPISEERRPSTATPWFMAVILSAGAIVVGTKNSRRTHLD